MTLVAPTRAPVREDALGRLLGEIAVQVTSQRRISPTADPQTVALGAGVLSVVYVLDGSVRPAAGAGLPSQLVAGDILLASGRSTASVQVGVGAAALVSRLTLADSATHLGDLLPDVAWISGFDRREPGVAALARHMGIAPMASDVKREGDSVICRMMATMLLQSVIRAWSVVGRAPEGWPSRTGDPFLDRVVDAVRDDPGREWTVEQMASIAALSRSVFAERFHAALGQSPAGHVTEVRMQAAKRMLADGRSVSDTSRSLGYGSDEGFSRAFRRETGVTPSSWRADARTPIRT